MLYTRALFVATRHSRWLYCITLASYVTLYAYDVIIASSLHHHYIIHTLLDYLAKLQSRNSSAMSDVGMARAGFHQSSLDSDVGVARGGARGGYHQSSVESATDEVFSGSEVGGNSAGEIVRIVSTTGLVAVDKALTQHLIHCECLLQVQNKKRTVLITV